MLFVANYGYCSPRIEFNYVEKGYVSAERGFWADYETGELILRGLRQWRSERDHWERKYEELSADNLTYLNDQARLWKEAEDSINSERMAWNRELRKSRLPSLGVFAGIGYTTSGSVEGVVGVGIVWKIQH